MVVRPAPDPRSVEIRLRRVTAAALLFALGSLPAAAQSAPPRGYTTTNWAGLSLDLAVFRPFNSHVLISDNNVTVGEFALTGIQIAGTATYLFQGNNFVLGPRIKMSGGAIEAHPFDYTVRNNGSLTFGGEAGMTSDRLYVYGFGAGGLALVAAEKTGAGRTDTLVSAFEVGAGFRFALSPQWYAKTEISYTTLGDYKLGSQYFDLKPFAAITAGFGFHF